MLVHLKAYSKQLTTICATLAVSESSSKVAVRALITSRLDYCNSLLNGVSAKTFNRLQLLQNKAARLIYMKPKRTHTSPLLSDLHWLRITQSIQFKTLVLTYKALHHESPQYLSDLLHIRSRRYNIPASLRTTLHIPRTNKSAGDRSFAATAPRLWNSLPGHISAAVTTHWTIQKTVDISLVQLIVLFYACSLGCCLLHAFICSFCLRFASLGKGALQMTVYYYIIIIH